jgi:hypothetical protein
MAEEKKHDHKKKPHAGHGYTHSSVQHHGDSSHTVTHHHEDGSHKDMTHAVTDLDGVHDSLQDHLGTPNPGEAEANAGPTPAPGSAPMPMPGAPGMPAPGGLVGQGI